MTDAERFKAVVRILEAEVKQQEALLKPMAAALREAIRMLPERDTEHMRTALKQYEFISGEGGGQNA